MEPTIDKAILARYADLKDLEKSIKAEIEELAPQIKEYLLKTGVDKLPTSAGTFTISERSTWQYTEAVEKLQEEEKATGKAKKVTITTLMFKAPKPEEQPKSE